MMSWLDTRKIIGIAIYGKSLFSGFCCLPRFDAMFGLDFCLLARQINQLRIKVLCELQTSFRRLAVDSLPKTKEGL